VSRSPRRTDLERDRRGASVVEYTLCAGLVALATLGGARLLGERTGDKADAHAACIEQLDCGQRTHRDSARPTSAAVSGADDDLSAAAPPAAPIVGAAMAAASDGPPAHRPAAHASALSHDPPIGDAHHIREALEYRTIAGQSFLPGGSGAADARVDIHPDDVMQGQLGDCYWMAAMAAVALRDPEAIRSSIREQGGEYSVTLWERRSGSLRPRRFDVAPSLPVSPKSGALVFAQTSDERGRQRELWPMLLEKALAQSKGSYQVPTGTRSDSATPVASMVVRRRPDHFRSPVACRLFLH
jgi:Flp pilus assembly pilin Flp